MSNAYHTKQQKPCSCEGQAVHVSYKTPAIISGEYLSMIVENNQNNLHCYLSNWYFVPINQFLTVNSLQQWLNLWATCLSSLYIRNWDPLVLGEYVLVVFYIGYVQHFLHIQLVIKKMYRYIPVEIKKIWNSGMNFYQYLMVFLQGEYNVLSNIVTRDVSHSEKDIIWSKCLFLIGWRP